VLAADLLDRAVAAQAGQHDLDLLLRRPAPVLALLAQPRLLVGRAAHAEPAAGQSLRRDAPPGLPGAPSQLHVNAGPGSGAPVRVAPGCSFGTEVAGQAAPNELGLAGRKNSPHKERSNKGAFWHIGHYTERSFASPIGVRTDVLPSTCRAPSASDLGTAGNKAIWVERGPARADGWVDRLGGFLERIGLRLRP
jgi:hypothetical protein